jgi:FtsH-binding integral membrane protein
MSMYPDNTSVRRVQALEYGTDERAVFNFFNTVYAWMAVGLAVTASVGYAVSQSQTLMQMLFVNRLVLVALLLGTWALAYGIQTAAMRLSVWAATALFLLYAGVIGALLSSIFIIYPASTLIGAFVMTGGTFGVMSLYGFITKRDLTAIGSILVMCFFGLLFASLVNIFMANDGLSWIITYGVLAVFIGLTAYRTQQLKQYAEQTSGDGKLAARYAIVGSLILYITFINMFVSILRIMGKRR